MKTILIYGDSNTWGYISGTLNPKTFWAERFPDTIRWPGILQKDLSKDYKIICEGLPGRTTAEEDPEFAGRNGKSYLLPCLMSQRPLDLVIFMLGTNDMKPIFNLTPEKITTNLQELCQIVENNYIGINGSKPKILIIAPPLILTERLSENIKVRFKGAQEKSIQLSACYETMCNQYGYYFYDASLIPLGESSEGIHFDQRGHYLLGLDVTRAVRKIFKNVSSNV